MNEAETEKKAEDRGWLRAWRVLRELTQEQRDKIRKSLDFTYAADAKGKPFAEAWEIVDTDRVGLVARLHTTWEMIHPSEYITWRKSLIRAMQQEGHDIAPDTELKEAERRYVALMHGKELKAYEVPSVDKNAVPETISALIDLYYGNDGQKVRALAVLGKHLSSFTDLYGNLDTRPAKKAMLLIASTLHPDVLHGMSE